MSEQDYIEAISKKPMQTTEVCKSVIRSGVLSARDEVDVDLVLLSVKELGLQEWVTYEQVCAAGIALGLELCPAEVGPALRLHYTGEGWIRVAMKPIKYYCDYTVLYCNDFAFNLAHNHGGPWLYEGGLDHSTRFGALAHFVFVRPKAL